MMKLEGGRAFSLARGLLYAFDIKALENISFDVAAKNAAVHTEEELRDRVSLPAWLTGAIEQASHESSGYGFDIVWRVYYRKLLDLSGEFNCDFLKSWVAWDIGCRNALSEYRASALDGFLWTDPMETGGFVHAAEFKPVIEALVSLKERGMDAWKDMDTAVAKARIEKAKKLAPSYAFNLDELMSYVVQYMVYKEFEYL